VNYYILQNYANRYYNGKPEERAQMLNEISMNISHYNYLIGPDELERRFKNMKAHYRRKRDDLEAGLIKSCEWEYFNILNEIFKDDHSQSSSQTSSQWPSQSFTPIISPLSIQSQFIPNQSQASFSLINNPLIQEIFQKSERERRPAKARGKKVVLFPKESEENQKNEKKRKSDSDFSEAPRAFKREKIEMAEPTAVAAASTKIFDKENGGPLDMSMKRTRVIEFNNANDIAMQLPDYARANEDTRKQAIKKISNELKKLDSERISVDEERLKLEIRRNELDKHAYTLTGYLQKLSN
jgi:RNase H-fold protein (predicted Holliday junction resolvase)